MTLDYKVDIVISFEYFLCNLIGKAGQCHPSLEERQAIKPENFIGL